MPNLPVVINNMNYNKDKFETSLNFICQKKLSQKKYQLTYDSFAALG